MKKSMGLYNFLTSLLSGAVKLLFRVKVIGVENEKFDGAGIYCSNHLSNWDAVILACVTKKPISFVAKKELFKVPVLRRMLRALGVEPIERGTNDLAAIRTVMGIIRGGGNVFMFPQGTRCPGVLPEKTEAKSGISLMVKHTKATVLPIGIYTKDYRIKLFKRVYVVIGEPIESEKLNIADSSREEYERAANEIFKKICDLCKEAESGEYDEKNRA